MTRLFKFKMTVFTVEFYNQVKDYLHPNLHTFIKHYQNENLINLPPYIVAAIKIEMVLGN